MQGPTQTGVAVVIVCLRPKLPHYPIVLHASSPSFSLGIYKLPGAVHLFSQTHQSQLPPVASGTGALHL